ncbi:MAG: hypothetical protein GX230_08410 [Lentisphaerae bacterium]|jgi:hypothetical protein|nr:hypothetical protein [Lentisphaerota bacterium]
MGASGKIYFLGCDPVISFAAAELAHYLQQMSGTNYVVVQAEEYRTGVDGWWLDWRRSLA